MKLRCVWLFFLLALLLLLPACRRDRLPWAGETETTAWVLTDPGPVTELEWELDQTGTLTIRGKGAMPDYAFMTDVGGTQNFPPWYSRRREIYRVKIEPGVTYVGTMAFAHCEELAAVSLPEGLVSIGDMAFYDSQSLDYCPLPESIEQIGVCAFSYSGLTGTLRLPAQLRVIGENAFSYCRALTAICLPENLLQLGEQAFVGCTALQAVEVEAGNSAFCVEDGVLYTADRTTLLNYPTAKPGDSFTVPDGVTAIAAGAFRSCSLTTIDFPDSLQTVGDDAFYGADALRSIVLPDGVSQLGRNAFFQCTALQSAVLPEGLTELPEYLFVGCNALTDVTIPESVTVIGHSAFRNCTALSEINLPPRLVRIDDGAFAGCTTLQAISLPPTVTDVGNRAFANTALTELHFPASVSRLDGAYWVSQTLAAITVDPENLHYFADDGILYTADGTLLCYPIGKRDADVTLPASTTAIAPYAFEGNPYLQTLILPDTLETIGEWAFADCKALTACTLPADLPALANSIFSGCASLAGIDLPDGLTEIPGYAFLDCTSLTELSLPEGVKQIGSRAFSGCTALSTISLPASLLKIDSYAFANAPLTTITYAGSRRDWMAIPVRVPNNELNDGIIRFLVEDEEASYTD